MQNIKILIPILFLTSLALCQSNINRLDWSRQFLDNPQKYFASTYEKAIFQKFNNKFPNIKLKNVVEMQDDYLLEIFIAKGKEPYQLMLQLDTQQRITSVYRYLSRDIIKTRQKNDEVILKWLGKFFYRLDAGDSAALYDMIFFEKNTIRYNDLSNKSEIVRYLIRKFPFLVQPSEIVYQEQTSFYSILVSIPLSSDIFFQVAHDWVEVKDSDVLQENLYHKIISELNRTESLETFTAFKNKLELLQYLKEYYPAIKEQGDVLVIPYPENLRQVIKEIRYKIHEHILELGSNSIDLDPIMHLEFTQDRGILILNNTCDISYYHPPNGENNDLELSEQVLKKIYKMLLLFPFIADKESFINLKGEIYFRGYKVHKIDFISSQQWSNLWHVIRKEGSIYYYPNKIDDLKSEMIISGLIYVLIDKSMDSYHFGELVIHIPDHDKDMDMVIKLDFYPFINKASVIDFNGSIKRP